MRARSHPRSSQILTAQVTVDMFLRSQWTDPRLAFTPASAGGCFSNPYSPDGELGFDGSPDGQIWTPGVAIMNQDRALEMMYAGFWIYPSGYVWRAVKYTTKLKCTFDFRRMPYDTLACGLRLVGWRDVDYDISFDCMPRLENSQMA